jgi:hypothetical protein
MEHRKQGDRTKAPDEEGIELHHDSWQRFERTVDKVLKGRPVHRAAGKTKAAANRRKPRGGAN